ncbi:Hypothetical predicted protein [Olea europaea subsp. europaea]|uniref:Uncharacterized protein n=1 Tax=Olea europaea subsp. europaea TaxID=158383 RepID=A0A8S0T152_OLEEU|nr:Hypothetical predicted protein [Olea europaea subsp. europaea]
MAGKAKAPIVGYCGLIEFVPHSGGVSSNKRGRNESCELENTAKTVVKDYGGGVSTKFSQKQKAGDFYHKSNGNYGFKEEVKYESSVKFDDKVQGSSTEYQTQVKFKKVTTYANKGAPKSSYKRIKYNKY